MKRIIFLMAAMALWIGQSANAQLFEPLRAQKDAENRLKAAQDEINEKNERALRETEVRNQAVQSREEKAQDLFENQRESLEKLNKKEKRGNVVNRVSKIEKKAAQAFHDRREAAKSRIEEKKEEFKANLEAKREEVKLHLEKKREEVKERLQNIKDSKKRKTAEHLYDSLNNVNDRITKHFEKVTDKLEDALARIEQRADKAEANGYNVADARSRIAEARTAIEAARSSVQTQAGKVYEFQADNTPELKTDIQSVRNQLRTDLEDVKTDIASARDAAHEALKALAQIPLVDELEVEDEEDEANKIE